MLIRLAAGSLTVIYVSPVSKRGNSWSVAEMVYDDEPRVGCRWNGDLDDEEDKGHPRSHGQGTWFHFPDEIGRHILRIAKELQD